MILVTGATGTVGHELVQLLSRAGVPVRAMIHASEKANTIAFPGVEVVTGDFADADSLQVALQQVSQVYLVSPSGPHQVDHEVHMIEACQQSRVTYLVKQSVLGADPNSSVPWNKAHAEIEWRLEDSHLEYTVLRPNLFFQNLLSFAPLISSQGVIYQPFGEARISMIDSRDVAAAAVKCLLEEGYHHETFRLTGPTSVTFYEVAAVLTRVTGQPIRYIPVTSAQARKMMLEMGMDKWLLSASLKAADFYRSGGGSVITGDVDAILHHPPHSLEQFARDYAEAFRAGTLTQEQQLEAA